MLQTTLLSVSAVLQFGLKIEVWSTWIQVLIFLVETATPITTLFILGHPGLLLITL